MKVTRAHAKKLAKYLEDEMGWEVFPQGKTKCSKVGFHPSGYEDDKFCRRCGAKMVDVAPKEDTIGDLVKALQRALR